MDPNPDRTLAPQRNVEHTIDVAHEHIDCRIYRTRIATVCADPFNQAGGNRVSTVVASSQLIERQTQPMCIKRSAQVLQRPIVVEKEIAPDILQSETGAIKQRTSGGTGKLNSEAAHFKGWRKLPVV